MAIVLNVSADFSQITPWLLDLKDKRVTTAGARAVNKTLANVRTESSKRIREERALKASVVKDALKIIRASARTLEGSLVASGRPIPLLQYEARKTNAGVTVRVSPSGRKLVQHQGNKAFQILKFGNNVYARVGGKRLPIKKLYGPSIPATFLKEKVVTAMKEVAGDNWPKRFAEELRYELSK